MGPRPSPGRRAALVCLSLVLHWLWTEASPQTRPVHRNPSVTEYRWGAWTQYSTCTRSCGIGIKVRQRACFRFGGTPEAVDVTYCGGVSHDAKTCNTQSCPAGARDFRSLQCSFFNGKRHSGADSHVWVPYRTAKFRRNTKIKPCALACTPHGRGHFVVQFSAQVVDGTECRENPHSVCVDGKCLTVGCDNELSSRARQDWCGVCGGDNSTCETLSGNIATNISVGYGELLTIPKGARHIRIVERDSRHVVLALRNTQGIYFINGHLETRYSTLTRLVAGTIFYYHHPLLEGRGMETFQAEGPISEDLIVMGHVAKSVRPVEILYEYTVQKKRSAQVRPYPGRDDREKSLPWEAILYEKLHPGYNIGAVGRAYVKRKKPAGSSSVQSQVPPWKPPEPNVMPSTGPAVGQSVPQTTPSLTSYPYGTPTLPPNSTPLYHLSLPPELPTSLPRRQIDRYDDFSFHPPMSGHNGSHVSGASPEISHPWETSGNPVGTRRERYRKGGKPVRGRLTPYLSSSQKIGPGSDPLKSFNLSASPLPTEGAVGNQSSEYPESPEDQFPMKHPVTDEMPVFIPGEEEADQGFRMTEDLIGSNYEEDTSENVTWSDEFHSMLNGHEALHGKRGSPASFSEGGHGGRTGDYTPPGRHAEGLPESRENPRYQWRPKSITPCSSTCNPGGVQFEFFECRRVVDGLTVLDSYCDVSRKPDPRYHQCTRQQCIARWVTGIWSHCSRSCGEGQTFRSVRCWRMLAPGFDSTVHANQCKAYQKPESTSKCNEGACGPQWQFGSWGKCSTECGRGEQRRTVRCNTGDVRHCQKSPRPDDRRSCGSTTCENYWKTTKWSRCSGPCGAGIMQRQAVCRGVRGGALDDRSCDHNTKPLTVHACGDKKYCQFVWVPQRWDTCSAECGEGQATRKVVCGAVSNGRFQFHPDSYCHRVSKPMTTARCREVPCQPQWLTTDWSKCSKSCGKGGMKMREVRCYHGDEESSGCDLNRKPKPAEECPLPACPEDRHEDPPCEDDKKRINCKLVLEVQLCQHWYYKTACCKSCKRAARGRRKRSTGTG